LLGDTGIVDLDKPTACRGLDEFAIHLIGHLIGRAGGGNLLRHGRRGQE